DAAASVDVLPGKPASVTLLLRQDVNDLLVTVLARQQPLAGANVQIAGATPDDAVTDGNGQVLFRKLLRDLYTVTASKGGFTVASAQVQVPAPGSAPPTSTQSSLVAAAASPSSSAPPNPRLTRARVSVQPIAPSITSFTIAAGSGNFDVKAIVQQ